MINFKSSTSEEEEFTKDIVLPVSLTILNLENLEEVHYHAMSPNISAFQVFSWNKECSWLVSKPRLMIPSGTRFLAVCCKLWVTVIVTPAEMLTMDEAVLH